MSCESTNELIRSATYDIILTTSMWGLINLTCSYSPRKTINEELNKVNELKHNTLKLVFQIIGITTMAISAYKYSK